ncbi:MAG: CheB methylesterase domain-containing protein [Paracoccaceae bacterium]
MRAGAITRQSPGTTGQRVERNRPQTVICIGASTGGVAALERILPVLPPNSPAVLVVQHIVGSFTGGLVRRLHGLCQATVLEAEDDAPLRPGTILVAPGCSTHLEISESGPPRCRLRAGERVSGHLPSVDALFLSAARASRLHVIAALLTGMGRDGAAGLKAIREAGGETIAQDEASSTVFGMPRVAIEIGAAAHVLPLEAIGPMLLRLAQSAPSERPR